MGRHKFFCYIHSWTHVTIVICEIINATLCVCTGAGASHVMWPVSVNIAVVYPRKFPVLRVDSINGGCQCVTHNTLKGFHNQLLHFWLYAFHHCLLNHCMNGVHNYWVNLFVIIVNLFIIIGSISVHNYCQSVHNYCVNLFIIVGSICSYLLCLSIHNYCVNPFIIIVSIGTEFNTKDMTY